MNHFVVFEDEGFRNLLPLVYWRCCWDLRVGYHSLLDRLLVGIGSDEVSFCCRRILQEVAAERLGRPVNQPVHGDRVMFIRKRVGRQSTSDQVNLIGQYQGDRPGTGGRRLGRAPRLNCAPHRSKMR